MSKARWGGGRSPTLCVAAWLATAWIWTACSQDKPQPVVQAAQDAAVDTAATPDTDAAPGVDAGPAGTPCVGDKDCPKSSQPCAEARCDLATHVCDLVALVDGAPCEDGDSCTVGDHCSAAQCSAGPAACNCKADADCLALDDGNLCNGKWFCDTTASPSKCELNPASVVKCPPLLEDPCNVNVCSPVSGVCVAAPTDDGGACEDGYVCTKGDHCKVGQCLPGVSTCPCQKNADCADDGDLCNGAPYCDKTVFPFTCEINPASVVTCAKTSDTACATSACNPANGKCSLLPSAATVACDDGYVCTKNDHCQDGQCLAGQDVCNCQADGDCAKFDDGNACNGSLYCNVKQFPHICEVNPASVVVCPSVADTDCSKNTCDGKSGKCGPLAVADGKVCDDDNPCTQDETCKTGACVAGQNVCPCAASADCVTKDDGNLCNGTLFCDKAKVPYVCQINPATLVSCPSVQDVACRHNLCQPTTGKCAMTNVDEGAGCEDGDTCTVAESCKQGACTGAVNQCPCQVDGDCKDDGNVCNGVPFCNKAAQACQNNPATAVACPTVQDTTCLANTCQPATGQCLMQPRAQGQPCNADENSCTAGDSCSAGECVAGDVVCSCQKDADCAAGEDGNVCNGKLYCDKTVQPFACKVNPATVVKCPNTNVGQCKLNTCAPATGVCSATAVIDDTACTDSIMCTVGDVCLAGQCQSGTNICGCQQNADCGAKEDGNFCNGTLFCDKSQLPFQCKVNPATIVICGSVADTACTLSLCQSGTGKCLPTAAPAGAPCDDGDACTLQDTCAKGACSGGAKACNDGDACTYDDCDPVIGCFTTNNAAAACDDGNACTADTCDGKQGCTHAVLAAGPCDDGNPCTSPDACKGGKCLGSAGGCDDGNPCTDDVCTGDGKACSHKDNHAACGGDMFCDGGRCGGCRAFQRVQRQGCDLIMPWPFYAGIPEACKLDNNKDREEFEDAAELVDGRLAGVGAASTDGTSSTRGWIAWWQPGGAWVGDKVYGKAGSSRLSGAGADGSGGLWAVGQTTNGGALLRPWLLHVDGDGNVLAEAVVADTTGAQASAAFDDVTPTTDGGVVAVGWVQTTTSLTTDALLARFDASGKLLWAQVLGKQTPGIPGQNERLWSAVALADGSGVVVAGQRANPKDLGKQSDGWLLKIDMQGQMVWQRDLGGTGHDALLGLALRVDGGLMAVGVRDRSTPTGPGDGWVVRADGQGNLLAQTTVAAGGGDELRVIGAGPGGSWLVGGSQAVDHTGDASWAYGYDRGLAWALRLDADLKTAWTKTYDGVAIERGLGGAVLKDGDLLLVGDTRAGAPGDPKLADKPDGLALRIDRETGDSGCACGFVSRPDATAVAPARHERVINLPDGTFVAAGWTTPGGGQTDGWLQGMDRAGKVLWSGTYGKAGQDRLLALARDGDGLVAVGHTTSVGAGGQDGWLIRTDGKGKLLTELTFGGSEDDVATSLVAHPQGGWLLAGHSFTSAKGKEDAWLLRVDAAGKMIWEQRVGDVLSDRFSGVAIVGDGKDARILATGWTQAPEVWGTPATGYQGVFGLDGSALNGKDGKPLTRRIYYDFKSPGGDNLHAVTRRADGSAVAVGRTCAILQCGGWWVWFDKTGEAVGSGWLHGGVFGGRLHDVVPEASGGFVAAGTGGDGALDAHDSAWTVRIGTNNKAIDLSNNYNTYLGSAKRGLFGIARGLDGHFLGVGQTVDAEAGDTAWVLAMDRWLYTGTMRFNGYATDDNCSAVTCSQYWPPQARNLTSTCTDDNPCTQDDRCVMGKCQQNNTLVCDDSNACTSQVCYPESGCVTSAVAAGQTCVNGAACASGNCGECPYTTGTWAPTAMFNSLSYAVADGKGGAFATGTAALNSNAAARTDAWVSRVQGDGVHAWTTVLSDSKGSQDLPGLVTQTDGGVMAWGWIDTATGATTFDRDRMRVLLGADGKVLSKVVDVLPGLQTIYAARALPGGGAVLCGRDDSKAWLARVDAAGKTLTQVAFGKNQNAAYLRDVQPLADGGWVGVGAWNASPGMLNGNAWIVRLDAKLQVLWDVGDSVPWGGAPWSRVLVDAPSGDILALGSFWSTFDGHPVIHRLTAGGKTVSKWLPEQNGPQFLYDALPVDGGSLVLVGYSYHYSGVPHPWWVQRVNGKGQTEWSQSSTTGKPAVFRAVVPVADGLLMAFGDEYHGGNVQKALWKRFTPAGKFHCDGLIAP